MLFKQKRDLKKPTIIGEFLYYAIRILAVLLIIGALSYKSLVSYINRPLTDIEEMMSAENFRLEYSDSIYSHHFTGSDLVNVLIMNEDQINFVAFRSGVGYSLYGNSTVYEDLSRCFSMDISSVKSSGMYDVYELSKPRIYNWYDEGEDSFDELEKYIGKQSRFCGYNIYPQEFYINRSTGQYYIGKTIVEYYIFNGLFKFKVDEFDFTPKDVTLLDGFDYVDYSKRITTSFLFLGKIKNPVSREYNDGVVKGELTYDITVGLYGRQVRATIILVSTVVIYVLSVIFLGLIKYYKDKSVYEMFEYRRKTTDAMAHDLKTPLAIISLASFNLRDAVDVGDKEKVIHNTNQIEDNVNYMNNMITNILNFSNSTSRRKITKTMVNVREEIDAHIKELTPVLNSRILRVRVDGEMSINTDRELWNQAIFNLIDNAAKYAASDSGITIELIDDEVTIKNYYDKDPGDISKLKEPFIKGDNSRGENSGSGLGLSIADNNLSLLGYKLEVTSEEEMFVVVVK